jgi:hypothetical protein
MATLREYFDTDVKTLALQAEWGTKDDLGTTTPPVIAKIVQDLEANAKYWRFFIPEGANPGSYANMLFAHPLTERCWLSEEGDSVIVRAGFAHYPGRASSTTLVFTRRIFLYIDSLLSVTDRQAVADLGWQRGFQVIVFDKEYAMKRSEMEKPLAFISHDTRDKESLVRELAKELSSLMCPVWYDEYSLKVGASLRASIEKGLKETRKCIVVLSPNFLSNEGWGRAEFDSVYTREIIEKKNVMLPVWHGVKAAEVYEYSPRLADKVGLNSSLGVKELAGRLAIAIKDPTA